MVADYRTDEGIRIRDNGDAPCLTASHNSEDEPSRMQGIVLNKSSIRRLTPTECERLQGFPDGWTSLDGKMSDTQRYKQLGNAVTVNVVAAVGRKIKES